MQQMSVDRAGRVTVLFCYCFLQINANSSCLIYDRRTSQPERRVRRSQPKTPV
jgi:hypothetical protein